MNSDEKRRFVKGLDKLMDELLEIAPKDPDIQVVKCYKKATDNLSDIFNIATEKMRKQEDRADILEFLMQVEALTSQFIKSREGK